MNKKVLFFIVFSLFIAIFGSITVYAQQDVKLSELFKTLQIFDIAATYEKYPILIDSILYFIFFVSIAQVTLGKQFEGRGGKGVVISVGLALAFAASYWSVKSKFSLGSLGPLAMFMFAIVVGIWIYRLLRGEKEVGAAIWITIIVIYIAMYMFFPQLIEVLQQNTWGRLALGLATILFVIALPMSIIKLFKGGQPQQQQVFEGLMPGGENPSTQNRPGWWARRRNRRALQREANLIRQDIQEIIHRMNSFYSEIFTICSGLGIDVNQAMLYLQTRGTRGTIPPVSRAALNSQRIHLLTLRDQIRSEWANLRNALTQLNELNSRMRSYVSETIH